MVLKTKHVVELFFCFTLPTSLYALTKHIDTYVKQTEATFRDKSARYGKDLKPGDPPSW